MSALLIPPPEDTPIRSCASCPKAGWLHLHESVPSLRTVHGIDLDVTEACNLACIYCFKWQKKAVHMEETTAKAAIDWLLESSGSVRDLRVNLMGGEPTLRFGLLQKIVPYGKLRARQKGKSLHFGCTTNCTTLTDELLAFWKRFGMGFHCSIDGIPEVQNINRPFLSGGPTSTAVEKNVPKILAYRPEVMARATISPASVRVLFESAKYFAGLGFKSMTFKAAVNCDWHPEDLAALRGQYEKLGDYFIDRLLSGQFLNVEEFSKGLRAIHSTRQSSRFPCGAGRGLILVDPRGDLWPCHRFGPHQCGGGFRLGELGGPFNDRLRAAFVQYNIQEDSKVGCDRCAAALTCRNWCYAECVDCTQTFYDPGKTYCEVNRTVHAEVLRIHDYLRCNRPELLRQVVDTEPGGQTRRGSRAAGPGRPSPAGRRARRAPAPRNGAPIAGPRSDNGSDAGGNGEERYEITTGLAG
jgi:uncharacterized protein